MSLTTLWQDAPEQIRDRHIRQIIAFAGDGKLLDGNKTSQEFREFIAVLPSSLLGQYAGECLGKV